MSKPTLSWAPFVLFSKNKWLTKSGGEIRQFPLLSSLPVGCTGILPSTTFRSPSAPKFRYTNLMMSCSTSHLRSPLNPRNETFNHNQQQHMQSGFENKETRAEPKTSVSNPVHNKVQHLVHSDSTAGDGWENCWKEGVTPWDLGRPTPILLHLHSTGALPKGRALIPGCGTGYDVVAIACPERYVVGLDISDTAINKAMEASLADDRDLGEVDFAVVESKGIFLQHHHLTQRQLSSSSPNADYLTFAADDFFTWKPSELFDLIFDYTFFCALEPDMRSRWARRIHDLLKPEGELITLIFPISDHVGGPPYKVSVADYDGVLNPFGFKATSILENELAVGARKGREKLARWKRAAARSVL